MQLELPVPIPSITAMPQVLITNIAVTMDHIDSTTFGSPFRSYLQVRKSVQIEFTEAP